MKLFTSLIAALALLAALAGCNHVPETGHPGYAPADPIVYPEPVAAEPTGAIYLSTRNVSLFEDTRARQVGDIVTIILSEATNAGKSSDTNLNKDSSVTIDDPILAGKTRVIGSDSSLEFDLSSGSEFKGKSSSNQNNRMTGTIAVTVAAVMPNGYLYVQGEKWMNINQGNEFIRLRGVIRPIDISPSNTLLSTQVADARISYSGTGPTAEVNGVGWLSRFFMSPIWPF